LVSSSDHRLLNDSLRTRREELDDEARTRDTHNAGKLSTSEVGAWSSPSSIQPGKLTRLEADPYAMSPASALHYASSMIRGIDRKAESAAEVKDGALASAFEFLDDVRDGQSLPHELLHRLTRELGTDLSQLRIHTGQQPARAAELLNARAVTVGTDVYFAEGAYDPSSEPGIELIAHEAAHVARNQRGGSVTTGVSAPADAHEHEADRFARDFVRDRGESGKLPPSVRSQMERAFGIDFSAIQIHEGSEASAMGAQAFTRGTDIYFQPGLYDPHHQSGQELLGHELAHVAQQTEHHVPSTTEVAGTSVNDDAQLERQADEHGAAAARGARVSARPAGQLAAPAAAAGPVQRKTEAEMTENEKKLFAIQGKAMFALLPAIEGLPGDVKTDFESGRAIAGPRMVAAMKAVAAGRGSEWIAFATANHGDMGPLPADQIKDIMAYMSAPKDARYYQGIVPKNGTGKYDGTVDPAAQTIAILFRARIVVGPTERGIHHPVDQKVVDDFKPAFKKEVEKIWSSGSIKPAQAIHGVSAFKTITNVAFDDDEQTAHVTFFITPEDAGINSHVNKGTTEGTLREKANEENKDKPEVCPDFDKKTGAKKGDQSNTQTGSAHEFGHAVGLEHPRPTEGQDGVCAPGYGKTAEERGSIMGAGHDKRVVKVSKTHEHNDFAPFITIGEKWGEELLPASLKAHNKWTAG
jgi:hypothetical protein